MPFLPQGNVNPMMRQPTPIPAGNPMASQQMMLPQQAMAYQMPPQMQPMQMGMQGPGAQGPGMQGQGMQGAPQPPQMPMPQQTQFKPIDNQQAATAVTGLMGSQGKNNMYSALKSGPPADNQF